MNETLFFYKAKVIRVIDGDTVEAEIDLGFHTKRIEKLRIYNYDAPEVKLYSGVTEEEKQLGLQAKERAIELLLHKNVIIETFYDRTGKYGRFLANIYLENGNLYSEVMINEGYDKNN